MSLIEAMFTELKHAPEPMLPSKMWEHLNQLNVIQLETYGIENFRNTVACNYFTFRGDRKQFGFLKNQLPKITYLRNKLRAHMAIRSAKIRKEKEAKNMPITQEFLFLHTYYTQMLFDYVKKVDTQSLLQTLEESTFGNPPPIYRNKKLITADLANSILEYYAISPAFQAAPIKTVIELGAGYGRNAAVFLQKHPKLQYIIVDIPPALYVSQTFLSKRFPQLKVFSFRPFRSFKDIQEEWEQASICFLLPHQMQFLDQKSIDLFINISSLHEMRLDQIAYYFAEIDRLVKGHFYTKQWQVSYILQEDTTIKQEDYPVPPHWDMLYSRPCPVQTTFFEALYRIP